MKPKVCFLNHKGRMPAKKWFLLAKHFDIRMHACDWSYGISRCPWKLRGHDLIVAQTVYHGLLACLFAPGTPLIVENHGDLSQRNKWIAKFVMSRAAGIRAVSDSTLKQFLPLAGKYPWSRRESLMIETFPAWTDIDLFMDAYTKYKKPGERIILYAGEIARHKGLDVLFNAFRLLRDPDATLIVVGKAQPRNLNYLATLALRRNAENLRISFEQFMPQEQLARRMAQADVVVVPSLREGYGRVAVEAMATGTPAIASAVGGLPEIVKTGVTGFLVEPGDAEQLAHWIEYVLSNPDDTRVMGHLAHATAYELYSTKEYVENYRGLIEGVISDEC